VVRDAEWVQKSGWRAPERRGRRRVARPQPSRHTRDPPPRQVFRTHRHLRSMQQLREFRQQNTSVAFDLDTGIVGFGSDLRMHNFNCLLAPLLGKESSIIQNLS
jgi:hypothetical protein